MHVSKYINSARPPLSLHANRGGCCAEKGIKQLLKTNSLNGVCASIFVASRLSTCTSILPAKIIILLADHTSCGKQTACLDSAAYSARLLLSGSYFTSLRC